MRGSSDGTAGKGSSLRRWMVTGTGSQGKWSRHQTCQSSRSVWMMLSVIWVSFRQSCEEQGAGLHPDGSPPT